MRRLKDWWKGIFSFGEAEYKGVLEMQKKVSDELAHLERLQQDLVRARADLPEALSKMQGQVKSLAEKTRETEEILAKLRATLPTDKAVSPEQLAERLDQLGKVRKEQQTKN